MKNLTQEQQNQLARELKDKVDTFVNSFNWLQLEVLEKYTDNNLFEYIRQQPISSKEYFQEISERTQEDLITEFLEENNIIVINEEATITEFIKKALKEIEEEEFYTWVADEYEQDIREYFGDTRENYPMWNTLFEFKHGASEETIQAAQNLGLGVIEHEDFNPILFMMSAGHSFYSAYWIPLYLEMYPSEKEKYTGIKYDHL